MIVGVTDANKTLRGLTYQLGRLLEFPATLDIATRRIIFMDGDGCCRVLLRFKMKSCFVPSRPNETVVEEMELVLIYY